MGDCALHDGNLARFERMARARPTMSSALVLALIDHLRLTRRLLDEELRYHESVRALARSPYFGGRLAMALLLAEQVGDAAGAGQRDRAGFARIDVDAIAAATDAPTDVVLALLDELARDGVIDLRPAEARP